MKCPNCGDSTHLYAKFDCKWSDFTRSWEGITEDTEGQSVECTACDSQFDSILELNEDE